MKQYHNHLVNILNNGTPKPAARAGMEESTSIFGWQCRYNLKKGFPLLTTKKVNFKHIVVELLWFLKKNSNIKYLVNNGCNIWNEDAYNYYVKKCKEDNILPINYKQWLIGVKENANWKDNLPRDYELGDTGAQYPKVWREWEYEDDGIPFTIDQIRDVVESLMYNPKSRRHMVTALDPAKQTDLALYWCHSMFQFNARPIPATKRIEMLKNTDYNKSMVGISKQDLDRYTPEYYLDCHMYQRSADMFLGVPYNIASYSLLTEFIALIVGMETGDFIHSFGDSHIYDNHREQVNTLLSRNHAKYDLPTLCFSQELKDGIDDFRSGNISFDQLTEELEPNDFVLDGYESYPEIKAKLNTGLK